MWITKGFTLRQPILESFIFHSMWNRILICQKLKWTMWLMNWGSESYYRKTESYIVDNLLRFFASRIVFAGRAKRAPSEQTVVLRYTSKMQRLFLRFFEKYSHWNNQNNIGKENIQMIWPTQKVELGDNISYAFQHFHKDMTDMTSS